jgi:hypothetical protein
MSKTPGFKEARAKFAKKPSIQKDRLKLKDALDYIVTEEPRYSKSLYRYNNKIYLDGLREISKLRKKISKDGPWTRERADLAEVLKRIRNYHVFRTGPLGIQEYMDAWNMAYGSIENKNGKYDHKKFVEGTKAMLKGVKYFDRSFVKKMQTKYLKNPESSQKEKK